MSIIGGFIMNYLNMNAGFTNWIAVDIKDGDISDVSTGKKIGVTLDKYKEIEDISMQYYNKLIEAGLIEKEKTPEEIAEEQNKLISALYGELKDLKEELRSIKDDKHIKYDTTNDTKQNGDERSTKTESTIISSKGTKSNTKK